MGILSGLGWAMRGVASALDPMTHRDVWGEHWWGGDGYPSIAGVAVTDHNVSAARRRAVGAPGPVVGDGLAAGVVFRKGPDGAREALPRHPVSRLLGCRPNARQTPAEFIAEIAWHLAYYRNAYCRVHAGAPARDNYAAGELEILHPRRLAKIERGYDGRLYYTFNPPATMVQGAQLTAETYRDDEIWHLRGNPLQEDGLLGEPIWKSATQVFARAIAVHEYGDIWFANNGQSGGIIKHPGTFKDKDDRDSVPRQLAVDGHGPQSPSRPAPDSRRRLHADQGHQRRGAAAGDREGQRHRRVRPVVLPAAPRRPARPRDVLQHRAAIAQFRRVLPGAVGDRDRAGRRARLPHRPRATTCSSSSTSPACCAAICSTATRPI
jgi:hypothetical protein